MIHLVIFHLTSMIQEEPTLPPAILIKQTKAFI